MKIVESKQDLELFLGPIESDKFLVIPVLSDHIKHGYINRLCLLYVNDFNGNEAILSYDHDELNSLDPTCHQMLIDKINNSNIFLLDKKTNMFMFPETRILYDIELIEYIKYGEVKTDFNIKTSAHRLIYKNFHSLEGVNSYIPLVKHIEYFDIVKEKAIKTITDNYDIINDVSYGVMNNIQVSFFGVMEANGIFVNDKYKNRKVVHNNLIYPRYNFYTKTGRPTCNVNGLNFLSMNKNDGSRSIFETRFGKSGKLLLVDYKSRHLYLIAEMIKEKFTENPHTYFGKIYLNKDELTQEEYDESKKITYQILYGGVPKEFEKIPFFGKIKKLMNELHNAYNNDGFLITPLYKRKLYKSQLGDLKKQKLFNYYFQAVETEYGTSALKHIIEYLSKYRSRCILYVYDSFLFDFNVLDGTEVFNDLISIVSENNKFPVSIEVGKNYNDLEEVFIK